MRDIRVAAAQFEHRDNDKTYNLSRIHELTRRAVEQGAEIVSFHECSICGYTFLQRLGRDELAAIAEPVPDGPSVRDLIAIAREFQVVVMAGLIEIGPGREVPQLLRHGRARRVHREVSQAAPVHQPVTSRPATLTSSSTCSGVKVGFLICYDNNLPGERADHDDDGGRGDHHAPRDRLHPLADAGSRDRCSRELWENRHRDPVPLRQEFQGPKGRQWLMRWLPGPVLGERRLRRLQQRDRRRRRHDQARPGDDPRPVRRGPRREPGARRRRGGGPADGRAARAILGPTLPSRPPPRALRQARRAAPARAGTGHEAGLGAGPSRRSLIRRGRGRDRSTSLKRKRRIIS